jgi:hypothetical protein
MCGQSLALTNQKQSFSFCRTFETFVIQAQVWRILTPPWSKICHSYKSILALLPQMLWGLLQTRFHATGMLTSHFSVFSPDALRPLTNPRFHAMGTLTSHFSVVADDALRPLTNRFSRQGYDYLSHPKNLPYMPFLCCHWRCSYLALFGLYVQKLGLIQNFAEHAIFVCCCHWRYCTRT